ncbi:MAG: Rieske 2Fe-2S domain-containing protein [Rhodospirillales bacterium]|nr:Rieske 2Fe-2S domain-containing protein [Rhodospirillales bacterium]
MVEKPGGKKRTAKAATELCAVNDIPDGGSNGFFIDTADGRLLYMAIRRGAKAFVYVNSCPHTGMPLDFQPGQFLNAGRTLIQCSTHGAQFRIDDGYCVSGPCEGDNLTAVETEIRAGRIYVKG